MLIRFISVLPIVGAIVAALRELRRPRGSVEMEAWLSQARERDEVEEWYQVDGEPVR